MIRQPMKAPSKSLTDKQIDELVYPVYGSWKLDGILCLTENKAYTSSMKLVQNRFIQRTLNRPEYAGLQGEIIVGDPLDPTFNKTSGAVRRADGRPDFTFYVFDTFHGPERPYHERLTSLYANYDGLPHVKILQQLILSGPKAVRSFIQDCIDNNLEGAIIRGMKAPYKEGRGTWKGQHVFKVKPFEDDEAVIVGFVEQMENCNEAVVSATGHSKRSSHKENMKPKGTLGKLLIRSNNKELPWCGKTITCGCGKMTHKEAQYIFDHQEEFLGKVGVYKYQLVGSIDLPRLPIWKGLRDKDDMTDY